MSERDLIKRLADALEMFDRQLFPPNRYPAHPYVAEARAYLGQAQYALVCKFADAESTPPKEE